MRQRTGTIHFSEETEFQILPLDESVRNNGILGTVKGTFCVMESPSRNGRMYPFKVWKRVVEDNDFKRKLGNRVIFGTVGHKEIDTDSLISDLKVSHRLTRLDVNEGSNMGYGEAEILDTPVGRVLYTLLKSGSKMAVSSKAEGNYAEKKGDINIVDENSFQFDRFDFVTDPGFLQAQPQLLESLQEAYDSTERYKLVRESAETQTDKTNAREFFDAKKSEVKDKNNVQEVLDMELIEKLTEEKIKLEAKLDEAVEAAKKLTADHSVQIEALKKDLDAAKVKLSQWEEISTKWGGSIKIQEKLSEVKKLEDVAGTVEEVVETLKRTDSFVDKVLAVGSITELKAHKQDSSVLKGLISEVGTPKEIKESIASSMNFIKRVAEAGKKKKAEALSAKFGIDVTKVKSMLEKMKYKEVYSALTDMKESLAVKTPAESIKPDSKKKGIIFGEANRSARMLGAMGNR